MPKVGEKNHINQQFYAKRLNTESFHSPSLKDQFNQLTDKIQHQIQVVKKNLRVKNLKLYKARQKRRTIQNQEQVMRSTLRDKIEQKMKQSQSNLQKMMVTKSTHSKTRLKFRQTTLSHIKSMEKTSIDDAFKKSQQYTKSMEKYLNKKQSQRSLSQLSSSSVISNNNTKYFGETATKCQSFAVIQTRKKVIPKVLKVSDRELKSKKEKRDSLEKTKEIKNLHQYIEKLNQIDAKRKTRQVKIADTVKLIEKSREIEKRVMQNKKRILLLNQIPGVNSEKKDLKIMSRNRISFSQIYAKKLEQKLTKKGYLQEMSFRQGNKIMESESKNKIQRKNSNLMKETIKQFQMKANFRYMERIKRI